MLHKALNSKGEIPYRFPRSSVKFQGHTVQSITDFDPNWAFPDYRPVAAFKSLRFALLTMFPSSYHHEILLLLGTRVRSMQKVKVRGQRSRSQRSRPNLTVSGLLLQFEFTYDDEMIHIAWCCLGEVPYCFSRSSVKFQGRTALKNVKFDPNWAFPDCHSNLNSSIGTKWYTKLEIA